MCSQILNVHFTNRVRWHTPKYLKPNLRSALSWWLFEEKAATYWTSNLVSSLVQLQPLTSDQMVTCQRLTLEDEALSMTSTCPLTFQVLSAPCLSNFSSAVPSLLLFLYSSHPSLPLVPHLFVKEQKCRYSSTGWCFIHYPMKGFLKPHWPCTLVLVQFHSGYIPLWWHTCRNRSNHVQLYFCTIDARMKDQRAKRLFGKWWLTLTFIKIYFSQCLYILSAEATGHCKIKSHLSSYCELYYWLN